MKYLFFDIECSVVSKTAAKICALLCVAFVSIPYLGNIVFTNWDQLEFSLEQLLLIIIIIQAAFPISSFLIKAFDLMNPAEE